MTSLLLSGLSRLIFGGAMRFFCGAKHNRYLANTVGEVQRTVHTYPQQGDSTMQKRIITPAQQTDPHSEWLTIEEIAEVEITSEDAAHPIESALLPDQTGGWRADGPGEQLVRLLFIQPQALKRIELKFDESGHGRTQEMVLRWSADGGESFQEIVRQQWNFSPEGSTSEIEDLAVDLPAVTVLELSIIPEISGGNAIATLTHLRIA
jgi:hypothetical protein